MVEVLPAKLIYRLPEKKHPEREEKTFSKVSERVRKRVDEEKEEKNYSKDMRRKKKIERSKSRKEELVRLSWD